MTSERIVFQSYNPYYPVCPQTRVVTRETLQLIRMFRTKGVPIAVEPEDGSKLYYVTEKGWGEVFTDPIFLFLAGIPLQLILSILANFISDYLKRGVNENNINIIIETSESGGKIRYTHKGTPISDEKFNLLLRSLQERKNNYTLASAIRPSPYTKEPFPIFLEHTDKIVGWAKDMHIDGNGLKFGDIIIVDAGARQKVLNGDLQGMSIAGIVTKSICSICRREYVDCNHISGNSYSRKMCIVNIKGMCLADVSIVKQPANPRARLELK